MILCPVLVLTPLRPTVSNDCCSVQDHIHANLLFCGSEEHGPYIVQNDYEKVRLMRATANMMVNIKHANMESIKVCSYR